MVVEAYGINGPLGQYRSGFTRIPRTEIDTENLPTMCGPTPIGRRDWYKMPPFENLVIGPDGDRNLVPMRGSKRGIASTEFSGRVYAYEYRMASLLGQKFGRWSKRTGKRILTIKTQKGSPALMPYRMGEIAKENFKDGFVCGYTGQDVDHRRTAQTECAFDDVFVYQGSLYKAGERLCVSGIVCVNLHGLSDEAISSVKSLAVDCSQADLASYMEAA